MSEQQATPEPSDEEVRDDGGIVDSRADGQLHFERGTEDSVFPVTAPDSITPLDADEDEGQVPAALLWAMKDRRHEQWFHPFGHPERLRVRVGEGDEAVYLIDDGSHHCMIGRLVGSSSDSCEYSLVARITRTAAEELRSGVLNGEVAFLTAKEAGLAGTAVAPGVKNVFDVDWFADAHDIPPAYLPGAPFIHFAGDLPTADR